VERDHGPPAEGAASFHTTRWTIVMRAAQNFAFWLAGGKVLRGWARSASGDAVEGISWIEDGIDDWRATGAMVAVPYFLALKAEALHLARPRLRPTSCRVVKQRWEWRWLG
jgi:predicted ATPase